MKLTDLPASQEKISTATKRWVSKSIWKAPLGLPSSNLIDKSSAAAVRLEAGVGKPEEPYIRIIVETYIESGSGLHGDIHVRPLRVKVCRGI